MTVSAASLTLSSVSVMDTGAAALNGTVALPEASAAG